VKTPFGPWKKKLILKLISKKNKRYLKFLRNLNRASVVVEAFPNSNGLAFKLMHMAFTFPSAMATQHSVLLAFHFP
jgi:hypothetical protein